MPVALTKMDLRTIYSALARLLPPGSLPRDPAEIVEIERVRVVVAEMVEGFSPLPVRGHKVFEWRLHRTQAPTMNEYAYLKGWAKTQRRKELDDDARKLFESWPYADLHSIPRRRWVRVTRFSPMLVDELSVDVLGGKMPIDALVRVGVLTDDNADWLLREAGCKTTPRGNTHVLIEVFELAQHGEGMHNDDEPLDAPCAAPPPRVKKVRIAPEKPAKVRAPTQGKRRGSRQTATGGH